MITHPELQLWDYRHPVPGHPTSREGHGLAQKIHEADRWMAATALALGLELVAGDGIYEGVDGLDLHRISPS